MRCRFESDGTLIPGCMGTAAAGGCGKSDAEILANYCTCRRLTLEELVERIERLECEWAELEELARESGLKLPESKTKRRSQDF